MYGPSPSLAEAHLKFLEATEKLSQSMGLSQEMVANLTAGRTRLNEEVSHFGRLFIYVREWIYDNVILYRESFTGSDVARFPDIRLWLLRAKVYLPRRVLGLHLPLPVWT